MDYGGACIIETNVLSEERRECNLVGNYQDL